MAAGIWDPFGTGSGWPEEQSGDDARSLTFTSDPWPEPLVIMGSPAAADLCLYPAPDTKGNPAHCPAVRGEPGRAVHPDQLRLVPGPAH